VAATARFGPYETANVTTGDSNGFERRIAVIEKYMEALADERQRAVEVASEEREKSAQALRAALENQIKESSERLREHITNQVQQINAALASAEKLELVRVGEVAQKANSNQDVANVRQEAAAEAIQKAELSTTKLFDSVTERVQNVQQWQAKMVGALALVGIVVPLLTALAVYALTRHGIAVAPTK
jgi:hypothetical protein